MVPLNSPPAGSPPRQAIGPSTIEISVPNLSQALNICSTLKGTMGLIKTPQKALGWAGLILCFWFLFCSPHPRTSVSAAPSVEGMKGIQDPPSSSTLPARLFSQSDLSLLF